MSKRKRYSVFFENNQESVKEKIEIYKALIKKSRIHTFNNSINFTISTQQLIEMALVFAIEKLKKENNEENVQKRKP